MTTAVDAGIKDAIPGAAGESDDEVKNLNLGIKPPQIFASDSLFTSK